MQKGPTGKEVRAVLPEFVTQDPPDEKDDEAQSSEDHHKNQKGHGNVPRPMRQNRRVRRLKQPGEIMGIGNTKTGHFGEEEGGGGGRLVGIQTTRQL